MAKIVPYQNQFFNIADRKLKSGTCGGARKRLDDTLSLTFYNYAIMLNCSVLVKSQALSRA